LRYDRENAERHIVPHRTKRILMATILIPAQLQLREDGTPFSSNFDDIYHSEAGGIGQAEYVFVKGNDLPRRWAGRSLFSILETGFGLGINFLVTWAHWRRDPHACSRLHFVSIEKHPFSRQDLRRYFVSLSQTHTATYGTHPESTSSGMSQLVQLRDELAPLTQALCEQWPELVPGMHRLEFEGGQVVLTLIFGDAIQVFPTLTMRADAFYLDGFSPSKNPELWSSAIFKGMTRVAAPGASLATYTIAASVKHGLTDAGFVVDRSSGYTSKRDMLIGRFIPRFRVRRHEPPAPFEKKFPDSTRHVIVIGAGLAGCAIVAAMAERGWQVTLLERQSGPAMEASGNPAGVFHPIITRDDSFAARLSRSGFLQALRSWSKLLAHGLQFNLHDDGLFVAAQSDEEFSAMETAYAELKLPLTYARLLTPQAASALIGVTPLFGGWYFPQGGWIDPAALCRAQLNAAGPKLKACFEMSADQLERRDDVWHVLNRHHQSIAHAPVVIVANSHDAGRLTGLRHLPISPIRGQLTLLPYSPEDAHLLPLKQPLIADGYVLPLPNQQLMTGASYDFDDSDPMLRRDSQIENLRRLHTLLPQSDAIYAHTADTLPLAGRTGFRCVTSDRMPMIGQFANEAQALARAGELSGAHFADLPRQDGLYCAFAYGSRGLVWASLAAEILVSQIEGEPLPIDRKLADGVDPARFLLRFLRQAPGT